MVVLCVVSLAVSSERLVKSVWKYGVLLGDWGDGVLVGVGDG